MARDLRRDQQVLGGNGPGVCGCARPLQTSRPNDSKWLREGVCVCARFWERAGCLSLPPSLAPCVIGDSRPE
jgi:hypothetical protein